jgi:bacterioferritin-associated ferredoxin
MYICICHSVTDREIQQAVKQGKDSFEQVSSCLKVATCCGRCKAYACEVIEETRQKVCNVDTSALLN